MKITKEPIMKFHHDRFFLYCFHYITTTLFKDTPPEKSSDSMLSASQYLQGSEALENGDLTNVPMINELFRFRFLGQMNHSYVKCYPVIVTIAIPNGGDHNG